MVWIELIQVQIIGIELNLNPYFLKNQLV